MSGSCYIEAGSTYQSTLARPTLPVLRSRARYVSAATMRSTSPAALALVNARSAVTCCKQSRLVTLPAPAAAAALPSRPKTLASIAASDGSGRRDSRVLDAFYVVEVERSVDFEDLCSVRVLCVVSALSERIRGDHTYLGVLLA